VPRAKSDKIWRRFRKACDGFFDRRDEHQEKEREENLKQKEDVCKELEALADAWDHREKADAAEVVTGVMELRARYKQVGAAPRRKEDGVWSRFAEGVERIVTAIPDEFESTDLAPSVSQKKKEELCERVEAMAGPEISTTDSAEQIAEQLRSALAANALKGGASDDPTVPSNPVAEVRSIQAEWARIGPVPRPTGQELWDRFNQACDKILAAHPEEKKPDKPRSGGRKERGERGDRKRKDRGDPEQNLIRKTEICEQAEALAADEDCANHRSKIKKLQRQWKSVGPMPDASAKDTWNRFRNACNKVLSESSKARKAQKEQEAAASADEPAKVDAAPEKVEAAKPEKVEAAEPEKAEAAEPEKAEAAEPEKAEPVQAAEPEKVEAAEPEKVEAAEPEKVEAEAPPPSTEPEPEPEEAGDDDLDMDDLDSLWDDVLDEAEVDGEDGK